MSNHRPHTDPGPSRTAITLMAALTLMAATISAWILFGGETTDTRHFVGFILGNTLAVGMYYKIVTWVSERATAQARIRRFKDLEECQNQARAAQREQEWQQKSYMRPGYTGQPSTSLGRSDTYRFVQEETIPLAPWVTAQTQTRLTTDTAETAETQPLNTGEPDETQTLPTADTTETQPLPVVPR